VGVGVGARGGSTWAGGDYLRGALGWERRANLRTTNKARSHTHTQAQATQPLHRGPPTPISTAIQHVLCLRRRASRVWFCAPRIWVGSQQDALPLCRRWKFGAALPVVVGRLARRRWRVRAAIPHGVARRITGGPIAGRLADATDARRLRRPRWPVAGAVLCLRRRASRGRFCAPRVWTGSSRDALSLCRKRKLGGAPPTAVRPLAPRVREASSRRKPGPSRPPPGPPPRPLPVSPPPPPAWCYRGRPLESLGLAPAPCWSCCRPPRTAAAGKRAM